jgi:serine/threonine-protein kinase RsbW
MTLLDVRYPAAPSAVPAARRAFAAALDDLPPELLEEAKIVVNELVTNGVRHGADPASGWVRLVVHRRSRRLRIEVTDSGEAGGNPVMRGGGPARTNGWGLHLVANLTDRWGFSADGTRTVWCELDLPR